MLEKYYISIALERDIKLKQDPKILIYINIVLLMFIIKVSGNIICFISNLYIIKKKHIP